MKVALTSMGPIRSEWIRSISKVALEPEVDDLKEWCLDLPAIHPSHVEWGGSILLRQIPMTGGEEVD